MRFVDLAASARAFMNAVRALPQPPPANEQLNGCGRSFRASFFQAACKLRENVSNEALSGVALYFRRRLPPEGSSGADYRAHGSIE